MGRISYDPVKNRFAGVIRNSVILRRIFYALLDLFFLRSWHIRRIIRQRGIKLDRRGDWTLLDAGCGFGQYDRFILKQFNNVRITAQDVKEGYLQDCRKYFKEEIQSGRIRFDLKDLLIPEEAKKYDFILCVDVLEHIAEDREVLKNLADALKPGGCLLMHSPSHYSAEDAAGDEESFVGEHARAGYSKQDISEKFRRAGLEVEELQYTYGRFGHLSWILSVKYPMMLLTKTGIAGLILLLAYYPFVMPFCLLLNTADLFTSNEKGNGIYALGRR